MPKTGLNSDELRSKAIEIAQAKIRENGPDKLRVSDVAKALGVSHAALYGHFTNKSDLLDCVVQQWLQRSEAPLELVLAMNAPATIRITAWFETLYLTKRAKVIKDPELYAAFDSALILGTASAAQHIKTLRKQIISIISDSDLKGDPVKNADLMLNATALFHRPNLLSKSAQTDRLEELRDLLRVLLNGLAA